MLKGQKLAAGSYIVAPLKSVPGIARYVVRNTETRESVVVRTLFAGPVGAKGSKAPRLTFRCHEGNYCALSQVWDGSDEFRELAAPSKTRAKDESLLEIALTRQE